MGAEKDLRTSEEYRQEMHLVSSNNNNKLEHFCRVVELTIVLTGM